MLHRATLRHEFDIKQGISRELCSRLYETDKDPAPGVAPSNECRHSTAGERADEEFSQGDARRNEGLPCLLLQLGAEAATLNREEARRGDLTTPVLPCAALPQWCRYGNVNSEARCLIRI